ncbi:UPF0716 protein FxsA [Friedmanniella endophytica]|uniref:UPF0716 protein FxsA n=1 Tax=Microlunatus kandeliicorticis TaxID=1759536 RepID=A0A7W3P6I8_9ACTN|nr:FxsA family protein [Microlunatus kandeliicorticis]MBA8794997.1 UPF0716 protein FxsA [Microlunatus kandeliicorticis]
MNTSVRPRGGIGFLLLVAVLVALPFVEIWLLIQVGQAIGVGWTLLILVVEAVFGAWLTKREGRAAWRALNVSVAEGRMPTRELTDAALVLVGGLLLIVPGFVTDVFGLICLIPFTRPLARWALGLVLARRLARFESGLMVPPGFAGRRDGADHVVIEGEVVEPGSGDPRREDPLVIRGELGDAGRP